MTLTQTTSTRAPRSAISRATHRSAALTAATLLFTTGVLTLFGDDAALGDHTEGLGALSEILTGLAFLAGAVALAVLRPVTGWRGLLWTLAPVGLALSGVSMLLVPVLAAEPPGWLFLGGVLPTFVGMIAAGVIGVRSGLWRWWTGVAVAVFLPIMFTLPFNTVLMAAVWVLVALSGRAGPQGAGSSRVK